MIQDVGLSKDLNDAFRSNVQTSNDQPLDGRVVVFL
jgi:hypothetical protein